MITPQSSEPRSRNVRALLVSQQQRAPKAEIALPAILRSPFLIVLWAFVISTVVGALLLGRVRVPRVAHGMLVAEPVGGDSLTPVLLLPSWSRDLLHAGEQATIDTGGTEPIAVTIAHIDAAPLSLASAREWLDAPNVSPATIDTTMVVARLEPCTRQRCPKLAAGIRYPARAELGTRSLASFAIPGS